jgi:hypothetical protein
MKAETGMELTVMSMRKGSWVEGTEIEEENRVEGKGMKEVSESESGSGDGEESRKLRGVEFNGHLLEK